MSLAKTIRALHLDALSSTVALNVDLDVVPTVAANAACGALASRLTGYHNSIPDLHQRHFLNTEGFIHNHPDRTVVRLSRRAYSPCYAQPTYHQPLSPDGTAAPFTSSTPEPELGSNLRCDHPR